MKGITVTQENMASVYGRLKKFFSHKKFIAWHNFDCGSRKKIKKVITHADGDQTDVTHYEYRPVAIELDPNFGRLIRVRLTDRHSRAFVIQCGDKVKFCGSKIIIKTEFVLPILHSHIYMVYQIVK